MPLRYLFGPVTGSFADQYLVEARGSGVCRTFGFGSGVDLQLGAADSWSGVSARLPSDWQPDFIALWLDGVSVPKWLWSVSDPLVGLAADWDRHWHHYRHCLARCDLVLADAFGADAFARAGIAHVRPATIVGSGNDDLATDTPPLRRDIDVLVLDDLRPAPHGERLQGLARVARLSDRYHVLIRGGVFDVDRRTLMRRARIVLNHSGNRHCTRLTAEVVAAGALLFDEAGNRELQVLLTPGTEYVIYDDANLEATLDYFLSHEVERATIAVAGQAKAQSLLFAYRWEDAVHHIEADWPALLDRASRRTAVFVEPNWTERAWQWISAADRAGDPDLPAELAADRAAGTLDFGGQYALGLVAGSPSEAAELFAAASHGRPEDALALLGRAEALRAVGRIDDAAAAAREALRCCERRDGSLSPSGDRPPYPPGALRLRAEWERIGCAYARDPAAELSAKRKLVRWRLNALLAELAGGLAYFHEAALARPDLPEARAALGCALARAGRTAEAVPHLQAAVEIQPFDLAAARSLGHVLLETGDIAERDRLVTDRRLLAKAALQAVPTEDWFAAPSASDVSSVATGTFGVVWEGDFRGLHSLALVNRELGSALAANNSFDLSLWPVPSVNSDVPRLAARPELRACLHRRLRAVHVHIRHQWPPRWDPPREGRWVLVQPWEYGSLPKGWIEPIRQAVDEVWVHSRHVRDTYIAAGVPEDRVHVIPLGVDPTRFRPDAQPLALPGEGTTRFLFVGGTIWRKGIDLLLDAFAREFRRNEPVTLLIKGMGGESYYKGNTADQVIAQYQAQGVNIHMIDPYLSDEHMPGLYTGCDCLVLPYRAEGFALPIAEAMACGRPVVVTNGGACRDYCDDSTAFLVAARKALLTTAQAAKLSAVGDPWVLEPDPDELRAALRAVVADPAGAQARGRAASECVRREWTWAHSARTVAARVRALTQAPTRRWLPRASAADTPPTPSATLPSEPVDGREHDSPPVRPRQQPVGTYRGTDAIALKQYGEKRTGTNLLQYMLMQHCPEVMVLVHVLGGKHSPPVDLAAVWASTTGRPDRERIFVNVATGHRPAETTNAKDPSQTAFLDTWAPSVGRAFAEGRFRFAISIKDPYAWVVSIRRIEYWPAADDAGSIAVACRRFNRRYREWLGLRESYPGCVRVIRYEDLLMKLAETMDGAADWLGLPSRTVDWARPLEAVIPTHWDDAPTCPASNVPFDPTYYTARRYLDELSPRAHAVIQSEIDWRIFQDLGYDQDGVG